MGGSWHTVLAFVLLFPPGAVLAAVESVPPVPVPAGESIMTGADKARFEQDIDALLALAHVDIDTAFIHDGEKRLLESGKLNGAIPKASWPHIEGALATAFSPERFKRIVRLKFIDHIDGARLPDILAWNKSPLGRKFIAAKDSVQNIVGEKAMLAYRDDPQTAPPSENRMKLLRKFDEATHASANEDLILQNMQKIFVDGFAFYQKDSAAEIEKITGLIAASRAKVAQRSVLSTAFIFRAFSDEELTQIIAFFTSPAGQNYVAAGSAADRALWADIHKNHLLLMMGQLIDKLDPP